MTYTKDEALKLALEALKDYGALGHYSKQAHKAITAIKQALTAPTVQEPIKGAVLNKSGCVTLCQNGHEESTFGFAGRLFADPPAAPGPTNCRHCGGPDNVLCAGQCKVAAQPAPMPRPVESVDYIPHGWPDWMKPHGITKGQP